MSTNPANRKWITPCIPLNVYKKEMGYFLAAEFVIVTGGKSVFRMYVRIKFLNNIFGG